LSYIKPHAPVISQRLAHWLKEILGKAGVNTSVFKAHSVRSVSSTVASEKGVLIEDILWTADWSRDSTFQKFYYQPSYKSSYAQAVLQPRTDRHLKCRVLYCLLTCCYDVWIYLFFGLSAINLWA